VLLDSPTTASTRLIAAQVMQVPQRDLASQMAVAVCISAGTAQRTLARDLDGEERNFAGKNLTPGQHHLVRLDAATARRMRKLRQPSHTMATVNAHSSIALRRRRLRHHLLRFPFTQTVCEGLPRRKEISAARQRHGFPQGPALR